MGFVAYFPPGTDKVLEKDFVTKIHPQFPGMIRFTKQRSCVSHLGRFIRKSFAKGCLLKNILGYHKCVA